MKFIACFVILFAASSALAQTTRPDDAPTTAPSAAQDAAPSSADQVLNQMLRPSDTDTAVVASPEPAPTSLSIPQAISPAGSTGPIWREGTDIVDRMGRLKKSPDGVQEEFTFDSDRRALGDPPVILLPNLLLMQMETALSQASHDLRFRITGTVTEYHGRNYLLLERFVVVQDKNQEF